VAGEVRLRRQLETVSYGLDRMWFLVVRVGCMLTMEIRSRVAGEQGGASELLCQQGCKLGVVEKARKTKCAMSHQRKNDLARRL